MTTKNGQVTKGNVSRSEPKQVNPQRALYEDFQSIPDSEQDNYLFYSSNFKHIPCVHTNDYWLCQECEIRIREQDLIDRISLIVNHSLTIDMIYPDGLYGITTQNIINTIELESLMKEFTVFVSSTGLIAY